jgi:hypothetical protein
MQRDIWLHSGRRAYVLSMLRRGRMIPLNLSRFAVSCGASEWSRRGRREAISELPTHRELA